MHRMVALALLLAFHSAGADTAAGEQRLARYTTTPVTPDPEAANPLAVVATVRFPRERVRTVGEAVDYLLLRTGFRLDSTDSAAHELLSHPLPEAHRELGPYRAQAILELLVGLPYQVITSHVQRTVAIGLRTSTPTATPDEPRPEPALAPVEAASSGNGGILPVFASEVGP